MDMDYYCNKNMGSIEESWEKRGSGINWAEETFICTDFLIEYFWLNEIRWGYIDLNEENTKIYPNQCKWGK